MTYLKQTSELGPKVKAAIERLKSFEPPEGYYLAYSGGKDSDTCMALCDLAGVKYDAHYRITSVDPPELYNHIRHDHPDVKRDTPRDKNGKAITMWNLIPRKMMPPTRIARFCCQELKEDGGVGRLTITGVRWAESVNRRKNHGLVTIMSPTKDGINRHEALASGNFRETGKTGIVLVNDNEDSRRMLEQCYTRNKTTLNPIIDWDDRDVWMFLRGQGVKYCELYDHGYHRLGCIGCPMASTKMREREFLTWPKYKALYLKAFERMLALRDERGKPFLLAKYGDTTKGAIDVYNWWMKYDVTPGQLTFEETEI